jgi:hypothetical protein
MIHFNAFSIFIFETEFALHKVVEHFESSRKTANIEKPSEKS